MPKLGAEPKKDTEVRLLYENALLPIEVTDEGIVTEVSASLSNALSAIEVTEEPMVTEVR